MLFILDTANLAKIKELDDILTVDGVTTNPTIITKTGQLPEVIIEELIAYLKPEQKLFIQVVKTDYEGIMEEARKIAALRPNTYAKIPVTRAGLKAIKQCKKEGIHTLATAIYSCQQGFLAAKNGADYLAPYVNRMCNYGDGVGEVIKMNEMLEVNGMETGIIAASFKNNQQVTDLIEAGIAAVTVPPEVALEMIGHPGTTIAVGEFTMNWDAEYGRKSLFSENAQ